MDVNLRKTATDTAYVLVGVGVLGFQQAQVKRRDAIARVAAIGQDARGAVKGQTDSIVSKATGCAASLSDLGSTVTGTVGGLGSTVGGTVGDTVSSTLSSVGTPGQGRRRSRSERRPAGLGRAGRRRPPGPGRARHRAAAFDLAAVLDLAAVPART